MRKTIVLLAIILAASAFKIDTYFDADPQQCIEEKCPNQWAACQKDSKCIPALQDCEKKCGTKSSCWALCLPGKGSQAAIDVAKCAQANGCVGMIPTSTAVAIATPQQCIEDHCKDQLVACQKDAKCFAALQDCDKECLDNISCYSPCLAKKGNANASNFWKCIVDNNCLNAFESSTAVAVADPQQCVEEKCPNQWAACQKDSKCVPAIEHCDKKCGTSTTCWTFCLPGQGSQAAIDVAKCAQANGCLKMTPPTAVSIFTGPEECILQHCKKQEEACANDRRCIQVMDECDAQCNTNFTCWNSCLARRGNKNASDYFKCIIDNQCYKATEEVTALALADPQQCIEEKCPNQWAACQKDAKCIPALQDCEKKCGTKSSCWALCLPGKGSQAAIDVAKCAQANGCVGIVPASTAVAIATPQQCIEEHCKDQLVACQKDAKCFAALQDCEKECVNNTSCYSPCLAKKGNANASNLWKCIVDNNCLSAVESSTAVAVADPQQCIEEKCPNQWAACQKDAKCIPALQDCEKKCGTKSSCWALCLPGKGSQAAIDVAKCAQANGCVGMIPTDEVVEETAIAIADPQQCVEEKCPNQWAACQKDSKCAPALQHCDKKCGTSTSCWTLCLPAQGSQAAIDVAKCAQANGCLKMAHPFESCMMKSCPKQQEECLSNWSCRQSLRKCRNPTAVYSFDHECLLAESKETSFLSEWYHCAGGHFCL
jgi:hypothetical protein